MNKPVLLLCIAASGLTIAFPVAVRSQPFIVTTLTGQASSGSADGPADAARFFYPSGAAVDSAGNIYVADTGNHTIRKITLEGVASTLAGLAGCRGSTDGRMSDALFNYPCAVAVDRADNVFVADSGNQTIRKITPDGQVSTLAGLAGNRGSADGMGTNAWFRNPSGIAVDSAGVLYVADTDNHTIRRITPEGLVSTLAGVAGRCGSTNGSNNIARFGNPSGVAVDGTGNVYVADSANYLIRVISPTGMVSTLAGLAGSRGNADGQGSNARFDYLSGVAVDGTGTVYVADTGNHTIRKIALDGSVSTLAGLAGSWGHQDASGSNARFNAPYGIAVDGMGDVVVADKGNQAIRKITPEGVVSTRAGLPGNGGSGVGTGDNHQFWNPWGMAADDAGNVYVADTANHTIQKITTDGIASTLAGMASNWGTNDGPASTARFNSPFGVAVDRATNIFVADTGNHTIRMITPDGMVSTLAGLAGSFGDTNGTGSDARFNSPSGVAVDNSGNVYAADSGNHTIRMITSTGMVSTLAGLAGSRGATNGEASDARFYHPTGLSVDNAGNVYVADTWNEMIRMITPAGTVSTLAGSARNWGYSDGMGSDARFNSPSGVAMDRTNNVYVADSGNHIIRKIMPTGLVATVAGLAGSSGSADGTWNNARFQNPAGVTVDNEGNLFMADTGNQTIRKDVLGTLLSPPGFSMTPQSQAVPAEASATFSIEAFGTLPLGYQWLKDGYELSGATNTTLILTNVRRDDAGIYAVSVTNTVGRLLSSNATFRVMVPQRLTLSAPAANEGVLLQFQDSDGAVASLAYATNFEVQASTNLYNWQSLVGSLSLTNGWLMFQQSNVLSRPQQFYRIIER